MKWCGIEQTQNTTPDNNSTQQQQHPTAFQNFTHHEFDPFLAMPKDDEFRPLEGIDSDEPELPYDDELPVDEVAGRGEIAGLNEDYLT